MTSLGDNLVQSARNALAAAMDDDDSVVVLGEDVASGGPFALTKGLVERHGAERVRNTPIAESAYLGAGIGLALGGRRPFVDVMFNDFLTIASDQLFNNAAKLHFMSGGRCSVPLTVWTIAGAGTRWGAHHSQHLDGWLTQVPGLKVLAPSSPAMAAAAVTAALGEPDPVVLVVDRALLYERRPLPHDDSSPWASRVVRAGRDVTLAVSGRLVPLALDATADLDQSVEVVDLQCLAPLDVDGLVRSVERTSRLVVAHDEAATGALARGVESAVYERGFWLLDAPVRRVTSPATPVPAAPELEDAYMLGADDLRRALREVCAG